tara:strand:- start:8579 stop:8848 length:270 start_codon:yes stop_codon:yes gene_type:complete
MNEGTKVINDKGELLCNILPNLNKSDAFICFGVKFNNDGNDELAVASFGDREGIVASIAYLLSDNTYNELLPAILETVARINANNSEDT